MQDQNEQITSLAKKLEDQKERVPISMDSLHNLRKNNKEQIGLKVDMQIQKQ